jgi:hypothetical protein
VNFPFVRAAIARRLAPLTVYSDGLIQYQPDPRDDGGLLQTTPAARKSRVADLAALKQALRSMGGESARRIVLLNANLNESHDIQSLLESLSPLLGRRDRVAAVVYNPYWAWAQRLAWRLGLRATPPPATFLTRADLRNLAELSDWQVLRLVPACGFPFRWLGLGALLNALIEGLPLLRELCFAMVLVLRPVKPERGRPGLSLVVPARDESGNIASLLRRLPGLGTELEVVFVEGHSTDGTWEEIRHAAQHPPRGVQVKAARQAGKGKADAVREGFKLCTGDLVAILDADLSMPPELLGRFYEAWRQGRADCVNGTRLVYPMEGEAMRPLNWLGNIFFAKALSAALGQPLGDSLCGTKLLSRLDLDLVRRWNEDFGAFDPFGDYELLFPACELGLGVVDVPIRYRARTHGTTKIHRFRDGLRLLSMVLVGTARIRFGRGRWRNANVGRRACE